MGVCTETRTIISAKKRHICSWCGTLIEIGESYKKYRWYSGNDACTVKEHIECFEAMEKLIAIEGCSIEFSPGENPRGGFCGHCGECDVCINKKANNE